MNWEAASTVAEVIGSLTLIISVIYLAIQVRGQVRQSRLAAARDINGSWARNMDRLVDDAEFTRLYLRFAQDYDSLPPEQRFRVSMFMLQNLKMREQSFLHITQGNMDPGYFESNDQTLGETLRLPGVQQWWEGNRAMFSDAFAQHIDQRVANAKELGYDSSYKRQREQL